MAKRYTQPQSSAQIDWSNPITRGLVFAAETTGSNLSDSVAGVGASGLASGASIVTTKTGLALSANGSQVVNAASFPVSAQPLTGATSFTVEVWCSLPLTSQCSPISQWGSTSNSSQQFLIQVATNGSVVIGLGDGVGNAFTDAAKTAVGVVSANAVTHIVWTWTGGAVLSSKIYINNVVRSLSNVFSNKAYSVIGATDQNLAFYQKATGQTGGGTAYRGRVWNRALSPVEIASLSANPWQIFAAPSRVLLASAGGGASAVGYLDATEAQDTAAFVASLTAQGTLAATEASPDTAAISGSNNTTGNLAATEASPDTAAISGTAPAQGTLASTETQDTAAFVAKLTAQGTLASTETQDTATFSGVVTALAGGTLSVSEAAPDTATFSGTVLVAGALAATDGQDTFAANGVVPASAGTLAATDGQDTALFSGQARVTGALAATDAATDTAVLSGTAPIVLTVTGALVVADASLDTAGFSGQALVFGMFAVTEAALDTAAFAEAAPPESPPPAGERTFIVSVDLRTAAAAPELRTTAVGSDARAATVPYELRSLLQAA